MTPPDGEPVPDVFRPLPHITNTLVQLRQKGLAANLIQLVR